MKTKTLDRSRSRVQCWLP